MANDEHLDLLRQGTRAWNEWREANPAVKPDLRHADLQAADLGGVNLSRAVLIDANLHGARLQGANLAAANLRRADLHEADFRGADLHGAILAKTDLRDADLTGADLREADLRDAHMQGAKLDQADMKGAVLHKDGYRYVSLHSGTSPAVRSTGAAAEVEPAAKNRYLKPALAAGGLLLTLALAGFVGSRQTKPVDTQVSEAVSKAMQGIRDVDVVEVQGDALILRSVESNIDSGRYVSLLRTACRTLRQLQPPPSGLREIRIINQHGEQGWVYNAPQKCGELLDAPEALIGLSIAANTQPLRKSPGH